MTIRDADPARDAAACAAIYAPFVTDTATSFEEVPPTAEAMAQRMAAYAARHPWLVDEEGGRVRGYAYASAFSARPAYRWTAETTVYVDPAHHRRGVGRRLCAALLDRLRAQGVRTACAVITLPNPGSVALHESMGFVPVGVFRRAGWKHGAWRDVGWWQLDLGGPDGAPAEPRPPGA